VVTPPPCLLPTSSSWLFWFSPVSFTFSLSSSSSSVSLPTCSATLVSFVGSNGDPDDDGAAAAAATTTTTSTTGSIDGDGGIVVVIVIRLVKEGATHLR
jgi:hypothetical protein